MRAATSRCCFIVGIRGSCHDHRGARMTTLGDRTAWLRWKDSNSEMSSQNIPLKARSDPRDPAEFWPQRLFPFEVRRCGDAARAECQDLSGRFLRERWSRKM